MPEGSRSQGGHPDAGAIAAHVDRKLPPAEAARVQEHLAGCSTCYELFAETVRFQLEEEEFAEPAAASRPFVARFSRRPALRLAAVLALAAGLVLASWVLWRSQHRSDPSLVADLVQAVGEQRFVEPRVTGGFRYARFVRLRSAEAPHGLDAQPPAVIAAVARVRERASSDSSPQALSALAVTYLVSGDVNAAVKALESAAAQAPRNPRLQSDLAAAYLARAARQDEPADLPRGLESAERSIALPDAPIEAWFNRALALEDLHLSDAARKAWQQYLERDSSSPWADEARKRLADLPGAELSSVQEDRARVRAALDEGEASLGRLLRESPSVVREYFDGELLGAWAEAQLAQRPEALTLRERALLVGDALRRATGEALAQDAARALGARPSASCHDPPTRQARGYLALREAQRQSDLAQSSCDAFREARRQLSAGGSPYAETARERIVAKCLYPSEPELALAELSLVERRADERGYLRLLGHVRWVQGTIRASRGDLTVALERYGLARDTFARLEDAEAQAFLSVGLAETLDALGDERRGWAERRSALTAVDRVREPRYFSTIIEATALACLDQDLLRTAAQLLTALVESSRVRGNAAILSDALTRRSGVLHALGADELAARDLSQARRWLADLGEPARSRMAAETAAMEGSLLATGQPERAAGPLQSALSYFAAGAPARVPDLRRQLARVHSALGLVDDAEGQLLSGIRLLEAQRASLHDLALQASFFEQAVPLFDDMVELQLDRRHDEAAALSFVERGRARQLLDSLTARRSPDPAAQLAEPEAAFRPETLQRQLPEGLALVYYVSLNDRLLAWLLTRDSLRFVEQLVPEAELSRLVAAQRAALERRAPIAVVRETGERLHDILVRPLLPSPRALHTLVFVPDRAVQGTAFAALRDGRSGRFLVEEYLLGLTPSGRFLASHAEGSTALPPHPQVLAVGNPRIDAAFWRDFPSLPAAEREAVEVASLYPGSELLTGRAATRQAFLAALRTSDVVHYAGHAADSANDPARSRLFLAPDPSSGDSGALALSDLPGDALRAQVVVLAACRTAAGSVSHGEGALSLSRPFLAAGVPSVVGSLWDVDDEVGRAFFVGFHKALLVESDAARALREVQLLLLRGSDPILAHPGSWSGFVTTGTVHDRPR